MRVMLTFRLAGMLLSLGRLSPGQTPEIPNTPEILHLAPAPSDRFPAKWYPRVGDGTDVVPAPVLDQPYEARVGDPSSPSAAPAGKGITDTQVRDRFGRTRSDSESGGMTMNGRTLKIETVLVSDPVSHCQFHWMQPTTEVELPPDMRTAFVTCGPQTLRYMNLDLYEIAMSSVPEGTRTIGDTTTEVEHLAPVNLDGLTIRRVRVRNTGSGEDGQVREWSTETWYSPELHEIVRLGSDMNGYTGLTEIKRRDPDPRLFYPPDGYSIQVQEAR